MFLVKKNQRITLDDLKQLKQVKLHDEDIFNPLLSRSSAAFDSFREMREFDVLNLTISDLKNIQRLCRSKGRHGFFYRIKLFRILVLDQCCLFPVEDFICLLKHLRQYQASVNEGVVSLFLIQTQLSEDLMAAIADHFEPNKKVALYFSWTADEYIDYIGQYSHQISTLSPYIHSLTLCGTVPKEHPMLLTLQQSYTDQELFYHSQADNENVNVAPTKILSPPAQNNTSQQVMLDDALPAVTALENQLHRTFLTHYHSPEQVSLVTTFKNCLLSFAKVVKGQQQPNCFISYAWEVVEERKQAQQDILRVLKGCLELLGAKVILDITNLSSDIETFMANSIEASDYVFLIGTDRLKTRIADSSTNVAKEYGHIQRKLQINKNALVPLLLDGDYGTAFPDEVQKNLIRDIRGFLNDQLKPESIIQFMDALIGLDPLGIIPMVYQMPSFPTLYHDYQSILQAFTVKVGKMKDQEKIDGSALTLYNLGLLALTRGERESAELSLRKAAELGHFGAMLHMAEILAQDTEVTQHLDEAIQWATKARVGLVNPEQITKVQKIIDTICLEQKKASAKSGDGLIRRSESSAQSRTPSDLKLIASQELQTGRELGKGGFGVVYEGKWLRHTVAIKKIPQAHLQEPEKASFRAEAALHAELSHPNILLLYGVCLEEGHYAMVVEYMPHGALYDLLKDPGKELPWLKRLEIALDITSGLRYLHGREKPILHRDLKSLNVLLTNTGQAKLSDFGLSKIREKAQTTSTQSGAGSLYWMAPELFNNEGASTATDVYALAVLFWELASRRLPYQGKTPQNIMFQVAVKGEREPIPVGTPEPFGQLITRCWDQRRENRPKTDVVDDELAHIVDQYRATVTSSESATDTSASASNHVSHFQDKPAQATNPPTETGYYLFSQK